MRFAYPVQLTPEPDGSAVNVSIPDVPGALTFGDSEAEAMALAEDCLIAALRAHVRLRRPIPAPSPADGRPLVRLPSLAAAKLLLYSAMRDFGLDPAGLAQRLAIDEAEVDRLLDLDHRSHIEGIERALATLGLELEVIARDAA
jgi:antitoxin HicB